MLLGAETGALAWAGLGNWLPLFWAFWAFQPHLASEQQRRQAAWMLVAGTLPVLLTGLGQMFLGWQGPWQLGGGAIIWFVAPGGEPQGRLSALFDYANIAGAWLGGGLAVDAGGRAATRMVGGGAVLLLAAHALVDGSRAHPVAQCHGSVGACRFPL